jgi:hypothetical protein
MADNPISYNRFTQLPANVAVHGYTVEEIRSQRGKPDRNAAISPMAAPRSSAIRLFLRPSGSDQLRVGEPVEPAVDPYEGATSQLSLMRSSLAKLEGGILVDLQAQVKQGALAEAGKARRWRRGERQGSGGQQEGQQDDGQEPTPEELANEARAADQMSNLMQDSLHRVDHMAAYLKNSYGMAQIIKARQVGSRS